MTAPTAAPTAAPAAPPAVRTAARGAVGTHPPPSWPGGPGVGRRGSRRRGGAWAALLLVLALAVTACGADGGSSDSAADGPAVADEAGRPAPAGGAEADPDAVDPDAVPQDAADQDAGPDEGQGGDAAADPDEGTTGAPVVGTGQGRQVVTSSIDVAVDDVPGAARRVRDVALVAGGYVAGESSVGGERARSEIVLRVPVGVSGDVMSDVAALGEEVSRSADSEDVEATLVDLESRTATQRAGVERIRALLQEASSLEDVLALEEELTRRQADLESVQSRQAALADRAALATVTVVLTQPDDVEVDEALPPFLDGLGAGWDALVASTTVVLVVLGALLPFAVVGLLVLAAVLAAVRGLRATKRRAVPARAAGDAQPPEVAPGG